MNDYESFFEEVVAAHERGENVGAREVLDRLIEAHIEAEKTNDSSLDPADLAGLREDMAKLKQEYLSRYYGEVSGKCLDKGRQEFLSGLVSRAVTTSKESDYPPEVADMISKVWRLSADDLEVYRNIYEDYADSPTQRLAKWGDHAVSYELREYNKGLELVWNTLEKRFLYIFAEDMLDTALKNPMAAREAELYLSHRPKGKAALVQLLIDTVLSPTSSTEQSALVDEFQGIWETMVNRRLVGAPSLTEEYGARIPYVYGLIKEKLNSIQKEKRSDRAGTILTGEARELTKAELEALLAENTSFDDVTKPGDLDSLSFAEGDTRPFILPEERRLVGTVSAVPGKDKSL